MKYDNNTEKKLDTTYQFIYIKYVYRTVKRLVYLHIMAYPIRYLHTLYL